MPTHQSRSAHKSILSHAPSLQDSGLEKLEYRSINFEADILPNEGYFQTR
jgi:hypothetical protein